MEALWSEWPFINIIRGSTHSPTLLKLCITWVSYASPPLTPHQPNEQSRMHAPFLPWMSCVRNALLHTCLRDCICATACALSLDDRRDAAQGRPAGAIANDIALTGRAELDDVAAVPGIRSPRGPGRVTTSHGVFIDCTSPLRNRLQVLLAEHHHPVSLAGVRVQADGHLDCAVANIHGSHNTLPRCQRHRRVGEQRVLHPGRRGCALCMWQCRQWCPSR